jgi:hypothetical protein
MSALFYRYRYFLPQSALFEQRHQAKSGCDDDFAERKRRFPKCVVHTNDSPFIVVIYITAEHRQLCSAIIFLCLPAVNADITFAS